MTEKSSKSSPKPAPKVFDVSQPGKSAAAPTSRPIIVTNRPLMQDPMVTGEGSADETKSVASASKPSNHVVIKPLTDEEKSEPAGPTEHDSIAAHIEAAEASGEGSIATIQPPEVDEEDAPEQTEEPAAKLAPKADETDETDTTDTADTGEETDEAPTDAKSDAVLEAASRHQSDLDKLVESRKYALPINSVEKRRSKQFALIGLILVIVLALAWVDVAMDAGLFKLGGLHPVTHFFTTK